MLLYALPITPRNAVIGATAAALAAATAFIGPPWARVTSSIKRHALNVAARVRAGRGEDFTKQVEVILLAAVSNTSVAAS